MGKCKHFAVGTFVVCNKRRAEVLDKHDGLGVMLVRWEDTGEAELLNPIAMTH